MGGCSSSGFGFDLPLPLPPAAHSCFGPSPVVVEESPAHATATGTGETMCFMPQAGVGSEPCQSWRISSGREGASVSGRSSGGAVSTWGEQVLGHTGIGRACGMGDRHHGARWRKARGRGQVVWPSLPSCTLPPSIACLLAIAFPAVLVGRGLFLQWFNSIRGKMTNVISYV